VTLTELILSPFSLIYGAMARWRAQAYRTGLLKSRRLAGVVISVGNLTVGGTGKTPMVLWIAERLLAEGKRVGILTRGYRGETLVTGESGAENASTSDEVNLLKNRLGDRVLFGVGPDRYKSGSLLAARGVEWFVLDDGFQHLQLDREVNIVLIDASNPFGGGRLLPAGRLREPSSALARADLVVITRTSHAPGLERAIQRHTNSPVFYAQPTIDAIRYVEAGRLGDSIATAIAGKLFAFCGIGNPNGFLFTLRDAGIELAGHEFFPDHHRYTKSDLAQIVSAARAAGATALTFTEKDLYNLADVFEGLIDGRIDQSIDLFCTTISMTVEREDDFWHQIISIANNRFHKDSKD
jgi:tetraacyldisaccharide 4'-kinase